MVHLDDMQVFVVVVDNASFSAAGRKLRMSTSKVSSRIARLEKDLGTRLLNRTTRSVETTPSGHIFYDDSIFILEKVKQATARAMETTELPGGMLKVSVPVALGQRLIVPSIGTFMRDYPEIDLQMELTDRFSDILSDRIDIAVRIGQMEDSNFKARILAPARALIVATPQYLKTHGTPVKPSDLETHNCLLLRFPGSRQFKWSFQEKGKAFTQNVSGTIDANNTDALRQMTLAHLGLSLQYSWDVKELIEHNQLTSVLDEYAQPVATLHAIYPYENFVPKRLRLFIDYLQQLIDSDQRFDKI